VKLIAGGQAAPAYRGVLDRIGVRPVRDLGELSSVLDELRGPAPAAGGTVA
jgi:hypothetical protein